MRNRKALALGGLALLAAGLPAMAGQVIVPVASGATANGTSFRTRIWVANPGPGGSSFSTAFIGSGLDGTTQETFGAPSSLPVGGTVALGSGSPAGKAGMVEISGSA